MVKQGESVAALTVSGLSLAVRSTGEEGQWQLSTVLGETLTSKYQVPERAKQPQLEDALWSMDAN